jgi:hypothetical protein
MTQREAAEILEMPESTVSKYVGIGLDRLRRALAAAGYRAAPAAVIGALAHTAPAVPASLTAVVEKIVAGETAAVGLGAGSAAAAAKGGLAMKVIAGVVLAGVLAGGAALLVGPGTGSRGAATDLSSPPADIKGPPKREHYAFGQIRSYLNGPRKQALHMECSGAPDEAGNLFILDYVSLGSIRCITVEGQVIPIAGNDHWNSPTTEKEGPAYMLCFGPTGGFGGYCGGAIVAQGRPLEGEDKGAIYTSGGKKIYKNKDGQWWFKSVPGLGGLPQIGKDGKLYICKDGEYFCYEDDGKKLAKVLAKQDYAGKAGLQGGESPIVMSNDGSFYISKGLEKPVVKVWPDKQRVEEYVVNVAHGSYRDGPATKTGWYCGPMLSGYKNDMRYLPPGVLLIHTADESLARRIKDGRSSTLHPDGEWRENPGNGKADGWNAFRDFCVGPNGTAFATYGGCEDIRTYRFSGIDWGKATVGPQVERK